MPTPQTATAVDTPSQQPDEHDVEQDLDLPGVLALAGELLRAERLGEAEQLYDAILVNWPGQPDALHFMGVLRHVQGDGEAAVALIRQAIAAMPEASAPWNNLGNVLLQLGRFDEAAQAYRRCTDLDPSNAGTHNNLGTLHRRRGELEPAEAACRQAIAIDPGFGDAWYNLSQVLIRRGRVHEGLVANSRAIALWPRQVQARDQVIRALVLLGELDQAALLYREWLAEDPDNPVVQHQLAACLRETSPPRATDAYVEKVFDSFAASFDAKLASLDYRAPQLVADALASCLPPPQGQVDIVDLGCGTGLVGPLVRGWARRLAGCDLSVGMLRQARQRKAYDVLHKAELVYYLETQPQAFDVAISADTLCYFGDLGTAMAAARRALRSPGWLLFTVEALDADAPEPWRLQPNGRYAHARSYVESTLLAAGLEPEAIVAESLRKEAGEWVRGWLVTARRA